MTAPEPGTVAALREGQRVDGVFACAGKTTLRTRETRQPYVRVQLSDRSGTVVGFLFDDLETHADAFAEGDAVRVTGVVEQRGDDLTIKIAAIAAVPVGDADRLLPSAHRDRDELDGFLEYLADQVFAEGYRALLDLILGDGRLRDALRVAPCTRRGHHAYKGGLLEHTVAVATLAQEVCQLHPQLNSDLLMTAAITHDIGKTRAFTIGARFGLTTEGRLCDHASVGSEMVGARARRVASLARDDRLALQHCIQTHHLRDGQRFELPEAKALYLVNALDAGVKGEIEHPRRSA